MAGPASAIDKLNGALIPTGSGYDHTMKIAAIAGGAPTSPGTLLSAWDKLDYALQPDGTGGYTLSTTGGGGGGGSGAAADLTGTTLAANVVNSSLTSVGVLVGPHMTAATVDSGGLVVAAGGLAVTAGGLSVAAGGLDVGGQVGLHDGAVAGGETLLTLTPGAHTAVVAEVVDVDHASHTITITGSYATERFTLFRQPTITAGSALTVTTAATMAIAGAPIAAGSALITRPLALWLQDGALGIDGNGALSNSALQLRGTWITGGSATTNKPHVLIEPTGVTSTGWNVNGTGLGIAQVTSYSGNLLDLQQNGVSVFRIGGTTTSSTGGIFADAGLTLTNTRNVARTNMASFVQSAASGTSPTLMLLQSGAHTAAPVAEQTDVHMNLTASLAFTTGAGTVAALRAVRIRPRTYTAGTAATTFTQAATVAIEGPPIAGANVVFTNTPVALWLAGALRLDTNVANGTTAALFTAASAPAAANTAIQEWFVVYNSSGQQRFIPAW